MMKRRLLTLILTVTAVLSVYITAAALTSSDTQAKSVLTYTVTLHPSGEGDLYWNYGSNMEFFITGTNTFNRRCLIKKNDKSRFPMITQRCMIAKPRSGWYFDGFWDETGRKLTLHSTKSDIIRIKKNGITYYDCIPSADNPEYSRYSKEAYREIMKTTIKALYGTRTYKTVGHEVLYQIPKKTAHYTPVFRKLQTPEFPDSLTLTKRLSDPDFFIAPSLKNPEAVYSSSSSRVVSVEKKTGKGSICGPGTAVVSVKIPEGRTTLAATFQVKISVLPERITALTASRTGDRKYVKLSWKGNRLYSGYEVQISAEKNFSTRSASKTVPSGKTTATKVRTAKSAVCTYAQVRPYKKSGGRKLYGPYTICKIH